MIRKPETVSDFEGVNKVLQDFYNNFGADDLKPSGVRTEAPTTDTLNKGRQTIVEIAGVPYIYYLSLSGVLYRTAMTAV